MLTRWKKVLEVMLCKIPGSYDLEKLRVIQLIEANLNILRSASTYIYLRLVWGKRLVHNALHHDLFLEEQFGNHTGVQGSCAALLKTISSDLILIRLLRTNATIFNNSAKACYDRIISGFSQLCCQSLGLPTKAAEFMLQFLLAVEYHVRTAYGTSEELYGNLSTAIFGVLQGSGSAPAIRLAVSNMLICNYNNKFILEGTPNPTRTDFLTKLLGAFV